MQLRPYQLEVVEKTRESFKNKMIRPLIVLPCGAGKTVCFADMANKHVSKSEKNIVWFLVHRRELVDQTVKTFERFNIPMSQVKVGMVQSYKKISEKPTMIIFDEAHHASAKTWKRIIDENSDIPMIGLTATPARMNGEPLGNIFNHLVIGESAEELIKQGFLSKYDYFAPKINIDETKFVIKNGDFDQTIVTKIFEESKIFGDITKYIDYNRKTIIYSPSIQFSKQLCEKIPGVVHFDGETPKKERDKIVSDFREGKIRILSNVDLIGEGFDVPDCDTVMLLRPTQSISLYIQQSMRCLRPGLNKNAVIYDFVGNVFRHGLPTENREWSLDEKVKMRNQTNDKELLVRECSNCYRVFESKKSICPYCKHDNHKTKAQIEHDKNVELQKINELEKKNAKREQGMAHNLNSLIELGKKRGYKNPAYWARMILNSRKKI